jgi:hypothetical protein
LEFCSWLTLSKEAVIMGALKHFQMI